MKIIVGCEESQEVTIAFRSIGHEAYSCDLQPCSGGHPEWHIQQDILQVVKGGTFALGNDSKIDTVTIYKWDMGIFFPDCTFVTVSGIHRNVNNPARAAKTERALEFVAALMNCGIEKIAIENPVGVISTRIRKPDQIIQPYNFGNDASKKTCIWLQGLPLLKNTNFVEPRIINGKQRWSNQTDEGQNKLIINGKWISYSDPRTKKHRSKTYPGIANAMATQWG